jgi:hypothetical protein
MAIGGTACCRPNTVRVHTPFKHCKVEPVDPGTRIEMDTPTHSSRTSYTEQRTAKPIRCNLSTTLRGYSTSDSKARRGAGSKPVSSLPCKSMLPSRKRRKIDFKFDERR